MVKQEFNSITGLDVKERLVHDVMLNNLGMRFRPIVKAALHHNSPKNLILR